jgi:hypothetical protein
MFESRGAGERVCPACRGNWERISQAWRGKGPPPLTWDPDEILDFEPEEDEDLKEEDEHA